MCCDIFHSMYRAKPSLHSAISRRIVNEFSVDEVWGQIRKAKAIDFLTLSSCKWYHKNMSDNMNRIQVMQRQIHDMLVRL
jgi:hypothetical protein